MKIGVCGGIEKAIIAKSIGYDYAEENLNKLAKLSDKDFAILVKAYEKLDFPVYSFNCFFGPENLLYEDDSLTNIKAYAEFVTARAAALGGSVCVVGSGKARNVAEGMDRAFCEQRFVDILKVCGEAAEKNGIILAIEPLSPKETNLINKVHEGADFARRSGSKSVGVLVDFFHFFMNNEGDDGLVGSEDILWHAHLARANVDRMMPAEEDAPTVAKWVDMLKAANYKGHISLEGKYGDDFEVGMTATLPFVAPFKSVN